jgi:hypothetical protein
VSGRDSRDCSVLRMPPVSCSSQASMVSVTWQQQQHQQQWW